MQREVVVVIRDEEVNITKELGIGPDLGQEMASIPGQLAYFGTMLSEAQANQARVEAEYRAWRAKQIEVFLEADPKLAEWKVRAQVEVLPQFMSHKEAQAKAEKFVHDLWAVYDAFGRKADMLRSKGARERMDLEKGYGGLGCGASDESEDERRERVAEITNRTKGRKRERPE